MNGIDESHSRRIRAGLVGYLIVLAAIFTFFIAWGFRECGTLWWGMVPLSVLAPLLLLIALVGFAAGMVFPLKPTSTLIVFILCCAIFGIIGAVVAHPSKSPCYI